MPKLPDGTVMLRQPKIAEVGLVCASAFASCRTCFLDVLPSFVNSAPTVLTLV